MSEQESNTSDIPSTSRLQLPDLIAAERAVAAIMTGVKNYPVFPPDHASTIKMIQGVLRTINQFGENYGSLDFEVGRQNLLYNDKSIYEGPASEENPAYVLQRSGISRFEFLPGIVEEELVSFFQVYNHYRVIADEPDDDLVSALWRTELPHIFYEASYELWSDSETALELENLAAVDPNGWRDEVLKSPGRGWETLRPASDSEDYRRISLALAPDPEELRILSEAEEEKLAEMVREELTGGSSEKAVRLLLILLEWEKDPQAHETVLGYLQETYLDYMLQKSFRRAYFILDNIRLEFPVTREAKPWAVAAYKNFYAAIIKPEDSGPGGGSWCRIRRVERHGD